MCDVAALREFPIFSSRQFRWLAQPRLHGLFVGEVLVFLLFKGKKGRADVAALTTGIEGAKSAKRKKI